MSQWQLKTPVAFFVFNRPDTTAVVFEAIRSAAPPKLLLVADGAREGRPGEAERCAAVREIVGRVDWPCEVATDFSEVNLGCRRRISSGLDWVFSLVEEAIILEDDCLPHPTFFRFCEELLERYREDDRVMMISGDNSHFRTRRTEESYYFSRYPHIWGWGCWRRSWQKYDVQMRLWPQVRDEGRLEDLFSDRKVALHWGKIFDWVYRGEIDTWDYQLAFACLINHGVCVRPAVNLVSNLGFGPDATHTREATRRAEAPAEAMEFPLRHPSHLIPDARAERMIEREEVFPPGALLRGVRLMRHLLRRSSPAECAVTGPVAHLGCDGGAR